MKFKLVTLEGATLDTFVYVDEAKFFIDQTTKQKYVGLKYGDKIPVTNTAVELGGNAANVAVGVAKSGYKTALLGTIGDDDRGLTIKKFLQVRGVNVANLKSVPGYYSNASIVLTYKKERTILTYHNQRPQSSIALPQSDWIYLSNTSNKKLFVIMMTRVKAGTKLAYNPNSYQLRLGLVSMKSIFKQVTVLFVNKEEAEIIVSSPKKIGVAHFKSLLKKIASYGPKIVVITNGLKGAYAISAGNYYFAPACSGERLEPTGAGDAFASGFLMALMSKQDIPTALAWGAMNAASVVTKIGAQVGLLSQREIVVRLKNLKTYKTKSL